MWRYKSPPVDLSQSKIQTRKKKKEEKRLELKLWYLLSRGKPCICRRSLMAAGSMGFCRNVVPLKTLKQLSVCTICRSTALLSHTWWVLIWAEKKHAWLCAHTCFYVFVHCEKDKKQINVNRVSMQHGSYLLPLPRCWIIAHAAVPSAPLSWPLTFSWSFEKDFKTFVSVRKKEALFFFYKLWC